MKTIVNLFIFFSCIACLSCDADTETPQPKIDFSKHIDFNAVFSVWNHTNMLKDRESIHSTQLSSTGISSAKYQEKFDIRISFQEGDDSGIYELFEQGIFVIKGKEGHLMEGTCMALIQHPGESMEMILHIDGGTGFYIGSVGNIYVEGEVDTDHSKVLKLEFSGNIIRPEVTGCIPLVR